MKKQQWRAPAITAELPIRATLGNFAGGDHDRGIYKPDGQDKGGGETGAASGGV